MVAAAILTIVLSREQAGAQTNLICNHSFESYDADVLSKLNNAEDLYSSHFSMENDGATLFDCWHSVFYNPQVSNEADLRGITWGIMPNLFARFDGTETVPSLPTYGNQTMVTDDGDPTTPDRAFPADNDGTGLMTMQNPLTNDWGFDLSPPTTKFGENVLPPDGSNYMALFDLENDHFQSGPELVTRLKFDMMKDVKYHFSMYFCKMNLLGAIKTEGGWNQVKEGKMRVYVCKRNPNNGKYFLKQTIAEIDINDNAWDEVNVEFIANRSFTHLIVEYDPINSGFVAGKKIAGAFIDNLKLYEACETPEIQCENASYRKDMLDAKLQRVELTSPYAYPDDNAEGFFKTIRAYKLDNAKNFQIKIYPEDDPSPCLTFSMEYPGTEWYWDGKNDVGNPMPDGDYKAILVSLTNECYSNTDLPERNFKLERAFSVFNVNTLINEVDGNIFITGLDNVQNMTLRLYSTSGQLVYTFELDDPQPIIGLSTQSLNTYTNVNNEEIADGTYGVELWLQNNCTEVTVGFGNVSIHSLPDGGNPSPYYVWTSVPKPDAECPFDFDYHQDVYSPLNCCEGDLYLEDMEIWNSWGEINILNNIYIGPGVVFEPGTVNVLNAGNQFVFMPDQATGVTVLGNAQFWPDKYVCQLCKNYQVTVIDGEEVADNEITFADMPALDSIGAGNEEPIVYPNPALNGQEITIRSGRQAFDESNYRLVLSNAVGVEVPVKVIVASARLIKFKPLVQLASGSYYLFLETGGVQKTFSVMIR